MKINMPVTDNEVRMRDDQFLVSKTDLKGILTFVNPDFIEVSGFTEKELIGKNHNMVRHPDMPPAAFEDLWTTVKSGKPWTGFVKNRCKNGDYYWVDANVTPITENGRVIGYMSVRNKPTRAQITAAEELYQKINAGKKVKQPLLERINVFNRMRAWQKLSIVGLLYLLVTVAVSANLLWVHNDDIRAAETELDGLEYLAAARAVMQNLPQHRGMSNAYHNGNSEIKSRILQKRTEVDRNFQALNVQDQLHGEVFGTEGDFTQILSDWNALKSEALDITAKESFSRHTQLLKNMIAMMREAGDHSGLSLESNPAGMSLANILIIEVPAISEKMGQIRGLGAGIISSGTISEVQRSRLVALQAHVDVVREQLDHSLETAFEDDAQVEQQLRNQGQSVSQGLEQFATQVEKLLGGDFRDLNSNQFFDQGTQVINGTFELYDATATSLAAILQQRIDHESNYNMTLLLLVTLAVAISALLGFAVIRDLLRSLSAAKEEFGYIAEGDYKRSINVLRKDEIGDLLRGIKSMQIKLGFDVNDARQRANEMQRIKVALDNVTSNVMVADNDRNIIYMNSSVTSMMRDAQDEIRKDLPNFDVDKLIGGNIDVFHKHPEHQRDVLEKLKDTYRARIKIGNNTFDLTANPVINADGRRLGTAVEWVDVTEQLDAEEQVQNLIDGAVRGKLDERIDATSYAGFMKNLSEGVNGLLDAVVEPLKEVKRVASSLSEGDLTQQMNGDYQGEFEVLANSMNDTVVRLKDIVTNIRSSGGSITSASSEIAQGNTDLSQRTEEQASSLEETASSMEELTSTVKQNADNARQANQLAAGARQQAEKGGQVVGTAIDAMSGINQSSKKIADIISVIDEIAFQTNLLALNAAVEAARAGEQGRGFAVVASEVRNLAQRSATAAKEIKDLITDSVQQVEQGSDLVNESGKTLEEIVTSVKKVSDIVAEIAAASQEQSQGIEQVNKAVMQMDEMTQQNAALVEEAAAASESLEEQAQGLSQQMAFFAIGEEESSQIVTIKPAPRSAAPAPVAKQAARRQPARATAQAAAVMAAPDEEGDEWEEF